MTKPCSHSSNMLLRGESSASDQCMTTERVEESEAATSRSTRGVSSRKLLFDVAICLALATLAFFLATYRWISTGALWPDSPRYANAAGMVHDWLKAGEWNRPLEFAKNNYAQYPAFNVPYHPPAYPGLLGVTFVIFGESYSTARYFIGICLTIAALLYYGLMRRLDNDRTAAFFSALLLLLTPDVVRWSRDTMSEVPALAILLAASWLFLQWLQTERAFYCILAFIVVGIAFFCRVTVIGVLPGWALFALLSKGGRFTRSRVFLLSGSSLLVVVVSWVSFVGRFSKYEVVSDGRTQGFGYRNIAYFIECFPVILLWGPVLAGLVGLAVWCGRKGVGRNGLFWVCWLLSVCIFKLVMLTSLEPRHFFMGIPAFVGLAAFLLDRNNVYWVRRGLAPIVVLFAATLGVAQIVHLPQGVVGYQDVASKLAAGDRPGNVFMTCWHDQDLIFRYRACDPVHRRQMIRGDRTLSVRLAEYAGVPPTIQARTSQDVLDLIHRCRARYIVTTSPKEGRVDHRVEEMKLAHQTICSQPDRFILLGRFDLLIQFDRPGRREDVYLWQYDGEFPEGPSRVPVVIPTAGIQVEFNN